MSQYGARQRQVDAALSHVTLPQGIFIRAWTEADFPAIQQLSSAEGWPTPQNRPGEALIAWQQSWPTLIASDGEAVVGFVRGLTDGEITTYIPELLIDAKHRGKGIGHLLLDVCHYLYPHTRIEVRSTESSASFYQAHGFRRLGDGFRKSYR